MLSEALAAAYRLDQIEKDKPAAVALLRAAIGENMPEATAEQKRLHEIVTARESSGSHGCHITKVLHSLLTAALSPLFP